MLCPNRLPIRADLLGQSLPGTDTNEYAHTFPGDTDRHTHRYPNFAAGITVEYTEQHAHPITRGTVQYAYRYTDFAASDTVEYSEQHAHARAGVIIGPADTPAGTLRTPSLREWNSAGVGPDRLLGIGQEAPRSSSAKIASIAGSRFSR